MAKVTLALALPTEREDGSPLTGSDIASVNIYRTPDGSPPKLIGTLHAPFAAPLTYVDDVVQTTAAQSLGYAMDAVDTGGRESSKLSDIYPVTVPALVTPPLAGTITNASVA